MILSTDNDYQETKLIKQGKKKIGPRFEGLAAWINVEYDVNVLNVYYERIASDYNEHFLRLSIIFEYERDELKFRDDYLGVFDPEKQKVVAAKFGELVNEPKEVFVVFSSFEPIARSEANEAIPQTVIKSLKEKFANPQIWEISRFSTGVTFFFYTARQVHENTQNGYKNILADAYFELLKRYDEFDYFRRESFSIGLDSKENFDNNYQSNWYYYYK